MSSLPISLIIAGAIGIWYFGWAPTLQSVFVALLIWAGAFAIWHRTRTSSIVLGPMLIAAGVLVALQQILSLSWGMVLSILVVALGVLTYIAYRSGDRRPRHAASEPAS